jgi:hypothetical protein
VSLCRAQCIPRRPALQRLKLKAQVDTLTAEVQALRGESSQFADLRRIMLQAQDAVTREVRLVRVMPCCVVSPRVTVPRARPLQRSRYEVDMDKFVREAAMLGGENERLSGEVRRLQELKHDLEVGAPHARARACVCVCVCVCVCHQTPCRFMPCHAATLRSRCDVVVVVVRGR